MLENALQSPSYRKTINTLLKKYISSDEFIVKVEETSGGIANKVLKLTTNKNKKYIFKVYKKIRNQSLPLELMKYLDSCNINVVFPINKEVIFFENTECYLYDYIENEPLVVNNKFEDYLINLLKNISKFKTENNAKEYYYINKCDFEFKALKKNKNYSLDEKIINRVLNSYKMIRNLPINQKQDVVHSDISRSNILNTRDGYYIIDFDETRRTNKIYDLVVILVKFYFDGKKIDYNGARRFLDKYLSAFSDCNKEEVYQVFIYYIVKQLLEKFYDYEIKKIDIYSKQQQQDDFRNWIFYFENQNLIKNIFI